MPSWSTPRICGQDHLGYVPALKRKHQDPLMRVSCIGRAGGIPSKAPALADVEYDPKRSQFDHVEDGRRWTCG